MHWQSPFKSRGQGSRADRRRWPVVGWHALSLVLVVVVATTIGLGTVLLRSASTVHADPVGYPNVFTLTSAESSNCFTLSTDGSRLGRYAIPVPVSGEVESYVDALLPPTTAELSIVATGGAGHHGNNKSSGTGGTGGNGAVISAIFPYATSSVLSISPGGPPDAFGFSGPAGNGSQSDTSDGTAWGGNAVVVASGINDCSYTTSNLLLVAGGGGGGGNANLTEDGGGGGNAGDDSTTGVGKNGGRGERNDAISPCGAGGGGGGGTLSAGGFGGSRGTCTAWISGGSGNAGTFLQAVPNTDGAGGNTVSVEGGSGAGGGGGYYGGGGGGGSTAEAGGGGGGGGSSFVAASTLTGTTPTINATNTSTDSSVVITALTSLSITANDKSYIYGSGPLPSFDVTYNGFLSHNADGSNVDTYQSLGGTLSCSTTATPASTVGDYPITCSGQTSSNYLITYHPGTLHIVPAGTSSATPALTTTTVGGSPTLSATVAAVSPSTATVDEGTVAFALLGANGVQVASAGPAEVASGAASTALDTSGLAPGTYTVQATFGPSANFIGSETSGTLFLLNAGVDLSSSDVAHASGGTASAAVPSAGSPQITSTASGIGTLVLAQYTTDPQTLTPPTPVNAYFDVYVPASSSFSALRVVDCNLGGAQVVYWWNGATWVQASDQTYNSTTQCATVNITPAGTSPGMIQLSGTPFSVQSTAGSQCVLGNYQSSNGVLTLNKATVSGCNLRSAALAGANLNKVTAVGVYLRDATFTGANLSGANLNQAYLAGADLSNANLNGADLTNATLAGAHLGGANLSGVTWSNTTCPDASNSDTDGGSCLGHL